ncbi:unnamed protein product [Triticum turgidum subsp. durum]|uniref:Uncharacterized protein n=1 Tax=Triticum turgidum subsp. durum TaxID=4567 RepID=A0A9R0V5A1_TRITD|nr:unnamed protein product [Triticum turgidum subsp. durum]
MPRNQIGDTVPGEVVPPPNQVGNRRVGPVSGAAVPPKQVRDRTPVSAPPPSKQRKDQTVRPVSVGAVLPTQVGGRTPVSVPPSLPSQDRNRRVSTVSGGEVPLKQAGNRSPSSTQLSPKQRRDQTVGSVSGREPSLQMHATQQGRPASSSKSRSCSALRGNTSLHARKPSAAATKTGVQAKPKKTKELEEADNEIRKLNNLGLGDDISNEQYRVYLNQLPRKPDVDVCTKLDAVQLKELNVRHALYRNKYYQLSQHVPEDKLCYDKLKEDYPPGHRPVGQGSFKCSEEDGELDWSFHPDYCKLAGLEDYQRLVPRNYGGFEYVNWDEYHKDCHSYEIEQEYVKFCEELSKKLKWIEAYVLNKPPSLMWGKILTRGSYQAIKIATDFSKIYDGLAFSGFYEWLDSMGFDVCCYNEFDGLYYEIWQRYNMEKKFRDALYEVYELNMFPLRQERMRRALENDTFCSDLEEEFLACTACLDEFADDKSQISEDKARELIAEALRKETQKPKFYEDYCRKKLDIAQAIGLIPSIPS